MQTHQITTYSFNELSVEAKETALDNARQDPFLGEFVADEALQSLKGFCEHYDLSLDYSFGLWPDRGEFITAKIDNDDIAKLSGVRLFKYLEKSPRSTYICKFSGKVLNTLSGECPFTGVCYDENLLDEMRVFMAKPDDRTFQDLINDCTSQFMHDMHKEGKYLSSDEYLTEELIAREGEFYENGSVY